MGSDDLHHKRKECSIKSFKRKKGNRKQYDVALIVCEGSKTEPNYIKGLCADLKLHPANIHIYSCPDGNDPLSIVKYAQEKYIQEKDYDRVYCVFDKEHTNYFQALNKINDFYINGMPIYSITSVPCFEYWLLLHFEESTRPYVSSGKKTAGEQLKSDLKKYIKNYHESDKSIFEKTKMNLQVAISRAAKINKIQENNKTDNPSTTVHKLVEYLMKVKD